MSLILNNILQTAVWKGKDDFPYDYLVKSEHENWLNYIKNKGWLDNYIPRLTKMDIKKRDEAFSEICAAYFLEEKSQFLIKDLEPEGANGKRGEFILCIESIDIFCEVKSPGWEYEIYKKKGSNSPRLRSPKHIPVEARWGDDSEAIRVTVCKAYKQIPDDKPSLLIIVDDFWRPLFKMRNFRFDIGKALFYESRPKPYYDSPAGCFTTNEYEKVSGILFLKTSEKNKQIIYRSFLALNKYALHQLPQLLKIRLSKK